jgi:hypothetical protein
MEFGEFKPDFEAADRRYAELERLHEVGEISDAEFDEQLQRSMVRDEKGRWWSKGRKAGEWHYHDGRTWVKGTPVGYAPAPGVVRNIKRGQPTNLALGGDVAPLRRYVVAFIVAFVAAFIVGFAVVATMAVLEAMQTGGSPCIAVGATRWCL